VGNDHVMASLSIRLDPCRLCVKVGVVGVNVYGSRRKMHAVLWIDHEQTMESDKEKPLTLIMAAKRIGSIPCDCISRS
jgi:hypothetical protein